MNTVTRDVIGPLSKAGTLNNHLLHAATPAYTPGTRMLQVYVDFLTARGLSTWLLGSDTLTLVYCHRGCHRATKQIGDPRQLVHPPTCLVHVCYVYVDFLKTGGLRTWLLGFDTLTLVFCHSITNYIAV